MLGGFSDGQYLVWAVRGHVSFVVTLLAGDNALVIAMAVLLGGCQSKPKDDTEKAEMKQDTRKMASDTLAKLYAAQPAANPAINAKDACHGGTALGWCHFGSLHGWRANTGDFAGVAELPTATMSATR